MVWKLLVLVLMIAGVLVGFRMLSGARRKPKDEGQTVPELETQKCITCGSYTVPDAGACEDPQCPYR